MCVQVSEPSAYEAIAQRAVDAGMIFTTYALPMPQAAGGALFPPEFSGEVTGKAAVEWIKQNKPDAKVLILEFPTPGEARGRTEIPIEMLAEQTEAQVVAKQPGVDQAKGLQVTEDVLQAHPDLSVVIAHSDDGGLGAAEAFRKAGNKDPKEIYIIGQDGSAEALTALKDPKSFFRASAALDIAKLCEDVVAVNKNAIARNWKPGDKAEYTKLAPTLIQNGDTQLIDKFLSALQ
jgi:ribose transport system substrate-binding protein